MRLDSTDIPIVDAFTLINKAVPQSRCILSEIFSLQSSSGDLLYSDSTIVILSNG